MAKIIKPDQMAKELTNSLKILADVGEKRADFAYRWAGIKLFSSVIIASPVDTGRFRSNWQITTGAAAKGTVNARGKNKGLAYVTKNFPKKPMRAGKIFLTNNLPYANTLEFGLYPNPPKSKSGKTQGGFSKLAPQGMVRLNVLRFSGWLKKGLRLAP